MTNHSCPFSSQKECRYAQDGHHTDFRIVTLDRGSYRKEKFPVQGLVFLLEGELRCSFDHFLDRRFAQGDLFVVPPASAVRSKVVQNARMLVLNPTAPISALCPGHLFAKRPETDKPTVEPIRMTEPVWGFARLMELYVERGMECGFLSRIKQKELFVLLQHTYKPAEVLRLLYPLVGSLDFRSWVLANYQAEHKLSDLAALKHITPKSFSRAFKTAFGTTFREWIAQQKATRISLRLAVPGTTSADIVQEFNFADLHHFYRFCKKHFGCTATELIEKVQA